MHLLQIVRLYRKIRRRRSIGVCTVLGLLSVSALGNAICFHYFEDNPDNARTFVDSLWYSVISITTIGYGDYYATSFGARIGTILFIVVLGLATFSIFLGMSIDWITDIAHRERRGMAKVFADDHILIVNCPSTSRVVGLIHELQSDPGHANREIVVVADQIEELPITDEHVLFVRGSVLEPETYAQARVENAKMAIVLATSYEDPNSDAVVASAVSVIDHHSPAIHIVAECLNPKHKMLFDTVNCDAIVYSMRISGNLLAQEVHDPGIAMLVDVVTSNVRGTTLFSTLVTDDNSSDQQVSYNQLAKVFLDRDINLICVNRDTQCLTSFRDINPQTGDRVIYAGHHRLDWPALRAYA